MTWFVSGIALIGILFNIKKDSRCFLIWVFTNAFWCVYDWSIGAKAQSLLFLIYFILSIVGLVKWYRDEKGAKHDPARLERS
jgi:membrane protein implicated in regulation of membrane protease activity